MIGFQLNKIKFSSILFAAVLVLLTSCKASKIVGSEGLKKSASLKQILVAHKAADFKFKTLQARVKVNYDDGKKAVSPSVTIRLEKDKQIWINAKMFGFSLAKVYITPTRVSFYEKLNKQSYDGNFEALSNFLGTDLDFKKVQNLLLGQSILELKNQKAAVSWEAPAQFVITPKKQDPVYTILLKLHQKSLKVAAVELSKEQAQQELKVTYPAYQKVSKQYFPESMLIKSKKASSQKNIELLYKFVETDVELDFRYSIPKGYTSFTLK